ncbi:MAG TPA: hypothetical protein VJN48_02220 [Terriglobales bacterium]|nr:hypothetical protein [Terriglobales bacterium]
MKSTVRIRILLLLIVLSIIFGQQKAFSLPGQNGDQQGTDRRSESQHTGYEPFEVMSRFLLAVYPDLAEQQGESTFDTPFSGGKFNLASVRFEFQPCRWSGVTQHSLLPYCGVPQKERFLGAYVMFGRDKRRPILHFNASGTFIDSQLQAVREQFKSRVLTEYDLKDRKRYWMREEALQALTAKNPKYGPDHKKDFLASLPIAGLQDITGCRLRPETAEFKVVFLKTMPPALEWTVRGDEVPDGQEKEECSASFEPFAGRLTSIVF